MEEKTQHVNVDIVPLPIDNNHTDKNEETEDEEQPNHTNNIKKEISMEAPPQISATNTINSPQKQLTNLPMDNLSPPPLPINADMDEQMHEKSMKTSPQYTHKNNTYFQPPPPPPPHPHVHVQPPPIPRSPRSPPKFMALHLRPPPPLTPMSSIASNGTVIMENNLPPSVQSPQQNNGYIMPPPPPQQHNHNVAYNNSHVAPPSYAIEYNCKLCRVSFNTKSDLIGHKQHVHGQMDDGYGYGHGGGGDIGMEQQRRNRFYCNICGRSFGGKQHFEYHMRTHSGEKPFKCPTCGKTFRAKHSLKNHLRIHTGERPYQCKVCGKWFRQLGVMKNHIKNMHSH